MTAPGTFRLLAFLLVLAASAAAGSTPPSEQPIDPSTTVPELFDKGRAAFGLDDFDLAEHYYREILIREPANLRALLELSNVYERNGKLEYARGLLGRAATLAPDDADIAERRRRVDRVLSVVLHEESATMMERGEYANAIPKIVLLMSLGPEDDALLYQKSRCLLETGQYDAALADLDQALRIDAREEYYELRARILTERGQKQVEELSDDARTLAASSDPQDRRRAIELLEALVEDEPENEWARRELERLTGAEAATQVDSTAAGTATLKGRVRESAQRAVAWVASLVRPHLLLLVTLFVAVLVFRSPLTRSLVRLLARPPQLAGRLGGFSLREILLLLNVESHSGVLSVTGRKCRGKIYFESGEPCHCVVGKLQGREALVHLIDRSQGGRFSFGEGAIPMNRTIDTPLSLILLEASRDPSDGAPPPEAPGGRKKSRMKELLESRKG